MRNNPVKVWKSFRFKIVLYTFLSLLYTITTEFAIFVLVKATHSILNGNAYEKKSFEQNAMLDNVRNTGEIRSLSSPPFVKGYLAIGILCMLILGIVIFALYFLLLTRKFSSTLQEIMLGIDKMAKGDLTARIQIHDEDEFAIIGDRLNAMADDIRLLIENERKTEKMKNDLITNVAHDLRTPLTSVIGYLDLVIRDPKMDEARRQKYIEVAYDKAERLEKLIGDLFSFTKFNSNEVKLNLSEIDIVKLVEQMIDEFYPAFQENELALDFMSECDSAIVIADGDLMARAFSNLISNAVKYGKDGKRIRIRISQTDTQVSVAVVNYGEVILQENLEHVFDRFYRVESSRNLETGGTGLGLAIAKKIVLMHNGKIKAASTFDGTVFEITLKKDEFYEK